MVTEASPSQRRAILRNRPLMTLTLGHFTVDSYGGLLPVLYPLLIHRFTLNLQSVGLISLAYGGMASVSQPLFGWVADRWGTRFTGLALIWTAVVFATIGFAPTFPAMVMMAGLAGLGSGAFHPFGALTANAVMPKRNRTSAMSVYVTGGWVGVAFGPLIGSVAFNAFGTRGTAVMVFPGLLAALWMLLEMRGIKEVMRVQQGPPSTVPQRTPIVPLLAVIGIMMSRSWTVASLQAFIPTWYASHGYHASFYGPLATVVVLANAFGTLGVGTLADRWGRRTTMLASLVLTMPALVLFAHFMGPVAFLIGAVLGFSTASSTPLMLSMAQQLMAGKAGVASGLVLGLGFVMGAIGVPVTGAIADSYGVPFAIDLQVGLVMLTLALAWFLPTEAAMEQLGQARANDFPRAVVDVERLNRA
ncbi:MAG: MFS transporter [Herpetosiphon sp.]